MSKNWLVSVIVPNYNHSKFLDQRIQSILNQTYKNFELIILDDCSPDNGASKSVIEQYRDNPHVSHIVYNESNSGSTFKQWDKGINLSKGDLVWIAESDDYCEPTFLETLVHEFERDSQLSLAYTLLRNVNAEGHPIRRLRRIPCGVTRLNGYEYVRRYMTTGNHCANASAALFKKEAYNSIDKQYVTYKAGGDALFWIEVAELGNVAIVNKELSYFRQHKQKVTPLSAMKGINSAEAKKTYDYICSNFNFSQSRKQLMVDHSVRLIQKLPLESEELRRDLLKLWGRNEGLSMYKNLKLKLLEIIQHRFSIYL